MTLEVGACPQAAEHHEKNEQTGHRPRHPQTPRGTGSGPIFVFTFEERVDLAGTAASLARERGQPLRCRIALETIRIVRVADHVRILGISHVRLPLSVLVTRSAERRWGAMMPPDTPGTDRPRYRRSAPRRRPVGWNRWPAQVARRRS